MTFSEKRNALVCALSQFVRHPVLLASQVQPEAEPPFIIYSATADYLPDGGLGDYSYFGEGTEDYVEARTEQPSATFSFTACSINRSYTDDDGNPVTIFGADEALELATLAQGFFLHGGLDDIRKAGFVVVEVANAGSRDALELDEMGRRYGFDVRLRYTRTDSRNVGTVSNTPITTGKTKE